MKTMMMNTKKLMMMAVMLTMAVVANSATPRHNATPTMTYTKAKTEAMALTDRMARELGLTRTQYNTVYDANLSYLRSAAVAPDAQGREWKHRNSTMQHVLTARQYQKYAATASFYRPLPQPVAKPMAKVTVSPTWRKPKAPAGRH